MEQAAAAGWPPETAMTPGEASEFGERAAALLDRLGKVGAERSSLLRMYATHPSMAVASLRTQGAKLTEGDLERLTPVDPMPELSTVVQAALVLEGAYAHDGKPMVTARLTLPERALREAVRSRVDDSDRAIYVRGLESRARSITKGDKA